MKQSAGILVYRRKGSSAEVLLAHPGGPFWAKKDLKSWGLVKGEYQTDEDPLTAAKREFKEELGLDAPDGEYVSLGEVKIPGKIIHGWAVEADFDASNIKGQLMEMQWPPKSGRKVKFPEVDRAEWFDINQAAPKMHTGQATFLERLADHLDIEFTKPKQTSLL